MPSQLSSPDETTSVRAAFRADTRRGARRRRGIGVWLLVLLAAGARPLAAQSPAVEAAYRDLPDPAAVERVHRAARPDQLDHGVLGARQEAGHAVLDQLGEAPATEPGDRTAGQQRLDDDQPEGLVPFDRREQGARVAQERRLPVHPDGPQPGDSRRAQSRQHLRLAVGPVRGMDRAGHPDWDAGPRRRVDGRDRPLLPREASHEADVGLRPVRPPVPPGVEAVMDHGAPVVGAARSQRFARRGLQTVRRRPVHRPKRLRALSGWSTIRHPVSSSCAARTPAPWFSAPP